MSERKLDALKSNEFLIRELEEAGWTLWFTAKRGDRTVSGHDLNDVVRRAFAPKAKKGN